MSRWLPIEPASLDRLQGAVRAVASAREDVVACWLYGSAARGELAEDLDVAVLFAPGPPALQEWLTLANEVERAAQPLPVPVDLRPVNGTPPRLRFEVVRDGRLLYERDPAERAWAEAMWMSEWLDFAPSWEAMTRAYLEHVAAGG